MIRALVLFCASVGFSLAAAADTAPADTIQIQGFTVEYAKVGLDKLQRMQPSLEHQMQIVEQSGVPPTTLEFFKSVPIIMVRDLDTGFGHAGRDEGGRQIVELKAAKLPGDRPILLHELLHAYHGVKLGPTPMIRDSQMRGVGSRGRRERPMIRRDG